MAQRAQASRDDLVESLRLGLVDRLIAKGYLTDPVWRSAFMTVPRHAFVPTILQGTPPVAVDNEDGDRWLKAVYADEALVTTLDGEGKPSSSSSQPSLMAGFLEALDLHGNESVLEIGTGTGYNAALLCERVGAERVATIDVDVDVVSTAKARLASRGYRPATAVADGADGWPERAPYDRIVATCSVSRIPDQWIRQLRPDGVLVTPLNGGSFLGGMVTLRKIGDGRLEGRFRREHAWFMSLKGREPVAPAAADLQGRLAPGGKARSCTVPPWLTQDPASLGRRDPSFLTRLHVPDACWDGMLVVGWRDCSWARLEWGADGQTSVTQAGDRRIWDLVEDAWALYQSAGQPGADRYGMTVDAGGAQRVWLDAPDGPSWDML